MTKRRNMAIAMAGAMVATTGAQAFATTAQEQTNFIVNASNKDAVIAKVGELLKVKYTSKLIDGEIVESEENVYAIAVEGSTVTNKKDFENKLNAALKDNTLVNVEVTDNGHEIVGEETVNYTADTYTLSTLNALRADETLATYLDEEAGIEEVDSKLVITLQSGEVIELGVGDEVLDFNKAYDAEGELTENAEDVVSFGKQYSEITGEEYTVQVTTTDIQEVTVDTLFDGVFLTEEGQKLVNLNAAYKVEEIRTPVSEEVATINEDAPEADAPEVETVLTGLRVYISNKARTDIQLENNLKMVLTITGEEDQLEAFKAILDGAETPVKLAGAERFDTAVEVSKELRKNGQSSEAIVLTSAYSLVDGLAAGPLAAQLNTSILLTGKDVAPEVTMNELKEVLNLQNSTLNQLKNKTVYVIGGEAVISEDVVAQIEALGVTVERVAGEDRHETSLAVANKLVELKGEDATITEAFVVGANGEADAMSISAYAAQTQNPIIVSGFGSVVNDEAVEFIADKNLTIIGGEIAVSEELEAQLDEANNTKTVERLAGNTRFETNAEVINKFHQNADAIFVAADGYKAGNDKLVDALTAAPLAAKHNAPIVLATEELTEDQTEVLDLVKVSTNNIFQVGGQVVNTVIAAIQKILVG